MKTILISSLHPLISRNILSTNVYKKLTNEARLIVLVPDYKKDYFIKEFSREGVIFVGVKVGQPSKTLNGLVLKRFARYMINTETSNIFRRMKFYYDKKYLHKLFLLLANLTGRFKLCRKLFRFIDYHLSPKNFFTSLLKEYKPDLVFLTDIVNENDVSLAQDAHRQGIKVLGMIRSWDNLTVLGLMRHLPDRLLVNNGIVKAEAKEYDDVKEENIEVVGVPHYDNYCAGADIDRASFFKKIGADPDKKLILFAPIGNQYIRNNDIDREILEILSKLNANIIVRFPPTDRVNLEGFIKPDNVIYDRPGINFKEGIFADQEISISDNQALINSLLYCDLVVSGPSTICIDAAVFNKPVIAFSFDNNRNYLDGMSKYYDFTHLQKLMKTGGIRMVKNREELLKAIDDYSADPMRDEEKRKIIIKEQCYRLDGKSSDRTVAAVLNYLNNHT